MKQAGRRRQALPVKRGWRVLFALGGGLAYAVLYANAYGADAVRGEKLHAACLDCHRTEVYKPPRAKIKSLAALKKEVERWNDHYNPKMARKDVEDVVAYLNRDFYKF